jgi:hypothetical protein
MAFSLTSSAFRPNGAIPWRHTCDGENLSPPFAWSGAPEEAKSLALVCTDPDAPTGVFHHWAIYDLAPDTAGLPEDCSAGEMPGAVREAINDFDKAGYGGPCPPRGHGVHHYHFRLLALGAPALPLSPKATCREVIEAAREHVLASAELVGVYER